MPVTDRKLHFRLAFALVLSKSKPSGVTIEGMTAVEEECGADHQQNTSWHFVNHYYAGVGQIQEQPLSLIGPLSGILCSSRFSEATSICELELLCSMMKIAPPPSQHFLSHTSESFKRQRHRAMSIRSRSAVNVMKLLVLNPKSSTL